MMSMCCTRLNNNVRVSNTQVQSHFGTNDKLRYLSFPANIICNVSIGITQSVPVHVPRPHTVMVEWLPVGATGRVYGSLLSEMALLLLIVAAPPG